MAPEEDQDTMTVSLSVEAPSAPAQRFVVCAELDQLQARARSAEERAADLERALATNRRIGIAIGILMCLHRLTDDQAIATLKAQSQHRNVKVRELAETVISTGTL
ncbi:ANTAR domain-containing protein [Pseudonocardia sp. RS010]|uniref:ANTAR domain-containing protein n=1 Tax=Pseudonocardia sp. RS010 TaxID=3385979 RepID=UPI0039A0CBDF